MSNKIKNKQANKPEVVAKAITNDCPYDIEELSASISKIKTRLEVKYEGERNNREVNLAIESALKKLSGLQSNVDFLSSCFKD